MRKRIQFQVLMIDAMVGKEDSKRLNLKEVTVNGETMYKYVAKPEDWTPVSENRIFRNDAFYNTRFIERTVGRGEAAITKLEERHYTIFATFNNNIEDEKSFIPAMVWEKGLIVEYTEPAGWADEAQTIELPAHTQTILFKRALRSSSQYRSAKMLMTHEKRVMDVRMVASYGLLTSFEGKMMNIAKVEPYISTSLTSSLDAGCDWTFEAYERNEDGSVQMEDGQPVKLKDYVAHLRADKMVCADMRMTTKGLTGGISVINYSEIMENANHLVEAELTDGQALGTPAAFARIARNIDMITTQEYAVVAGLFELGMSYKEQITSEKAAMVWNKIPRGVQFRYGMFKGFMIMEEHGYDVDFVFPAGTNKGDVTRPEGAFEGFPQEEIELCIAGVAPTHEKEWGKMNYQYIMALNLEYPQLKELADDMYNEVMKGLADPYSAMSFIGMVCNGENDEEYEKQNDAIRLREILASNIRFFYTPWVQNKIKKLMEKTIADMRLGRIMIKESRFAYIVTDPQTLVKGVKTPLLKSGEAYFNGKTGEYALFRNPLVHKSEAIKVKFVDRPELAEAFGHLNNILILNAFDDILPRMGGADTDGDKVWMTNHPAVLAAVEATAGDANIIPMVAGSSYDNDPELLEAMKPKKYLWENGGHKAILTYDRQTLQKSQIGLVTNWGTTYADAARHIHTRTELQVQSYWDKAVVIREVQGQIIDAAKRGTSQKKILEPVMDLKMSVQPHWLKDLPAALGKETLLEMKAYASQSPMGKLYDYVTVVVMEKLKTQLKDTEHYTANLFKGLPVSQIEVDAIRPQIEELEHQYRIEMQGFMQDYAKPVYNEKGNVESYIPFKVTDFDNKAEFDDFKQRRNDAFTAVVERHQEILGSIDASTLSIAVACLHVSELQQDASQVRGNSYPYVIATEYLIAMGRLMDGNAKLHRIQGINLMNWSKQVMVQGRKVLNPAGEVVGSVDNAPQGQHETFLFGKKGYLVVPVAVAAEVRDIERQEVTSVAFSIKFGTRYRPQQVKAADYALQMAKELEGASIDVHLKNDRNGEWLIAVVNGKEIGMLGKENVVHMTQHAGKQFTAFNVMIKSGALYIQAKVSGKAAAYEHTFEGERNQGADAFMYTDADAPQFEESTMFWDDSYAM